MERPRVVFLGTGGALNPDRYQAAMLVQAAGTTFLLDVGGGLGVVRRLLACEIDPLTVRHVVLSHRHLDHVGGLEPLLMYMFYGAFRTGAPTPPVDVHALPASSAAIRASLAAADASADKAFGERLSWRTPKSGEAVSVDGGATLTLVPVDHLPPGGEAAGCVVSADGVRVVYSGDTRPCDALIDAARGADLLIHEVGGTDARAELLHRVGHSTAADAGRVAARAGVRALAMFHTPAPVWVSPADMLSEARRAAPGVEVFLAEDGMRWGL